MVRKNNVKGIQDISIEQKETYMRMNFLYQAATLLSLPTLEEKAPHQPLSSYYIRNCKQIGKKTLQRM